MWVLWRFHNGTCLSVCLSVWFSVFVCLSPGLSVRLSGWMAGWLASCLWVCLCICLSDWQSVSLPELRSAKQISMSIPNTCSALSFYCKSLELRLTERIGKVTMSFSILRENADRRSSTWRTAIACRFRMFRWYGARGFGRKRL